MGIPASGDLSIQTATHPTRNLALEEDGNNSGDKSLSILAGTADTIDGLSMTDWYSYESTPGRPSACNGTQSMGGCDPFFATVTFTAVAPSTEQRFRVEFQVNTEGWTFIQNVTASPAVFVAVPDVVNGDDVAFRVRAERTQGGSQVSAWREDTSPITASC